jgi:hypothetical protein
MAGGEEFDVRAADVNGEDARRFFGFFHGDPTDHDMTNAGAREAAGKAARCRGRSHGATQARQKQILRCAPFAKPLRTGRMTVNGWVTAKAGGEPRCGGSNRPKGNIWGRECVILSEVGS